MTVFADSSALVKLYADEAGAEAIRSITEPVVVSQLARVEVPVALWRKQRLGELASEDAHLLSTAFEFDYYGSDADDPRFVAIVTSTEVLDDAARLLAVHGLRAYDAVQLASALHARAHLPDLNGLAAFDVALRHAASKERFAVIPPTT